MRTRTLLRLITLALAFLSGSLTAYGQISSHAPLSGVVTDPSGSVVVGAAVVVKNNATGAEFNATTAGNGAFLVPSLTPGAYTVIVTAPGFKQSIVKEVKIDASTPASVTVNLEVGAATETVTVQGGGDIIQTQTATVSTTIIGRQITDLPVPTRDALHLILLLPGGNTRGSDAARRTTINGLPRGAVNIMLDGVNSQEQFFKDTDFFSFVQPRLDAVEEVSISTATPSADSSGQGAVQIKFVTRGGSNEYHGGLYEYHRNTALNANYWFNNRDLAPDPRTGEAPRNRVILNQFGGKIGGPIRFPKKVFGRFGFDGHNRAFFFVNLEYYRLPNAVSRQRTIFNPLTQAGAFRYNVTSDGQTAVREVNLLALAAQNGQTATIDPVIGKLLADIRGATSLNGGSIQQLTDPNLQRLTFFNNAMVKDVYPTLRLDFNLTSKHHLEYIGNVQTYNRNPDILSNNDPQFPGFPNFGAQTSTRFSHSTAVRSTLTPTLVNEARFGLSSGTLHFNENATRETLIGPVANQAGFNLLISAAGVTNATVTSAPSRRSSPFWTFADNLSWQRGAHNLSFGMTFTHVGMFLQNHTTVPTLSFGVDPTDPASGMFSTANFEGASAAQLTTARNIYAVLTGRVTQIAGNAFIDEKTNKYVYIGDNTRRARQREVGLYAQDSWRWKPNLTLNYGLRWQVQFPFTPLNDRFSTTTVADLFGVSGPGNLFKPGVLTGKETEFVQFKQGDKPYPTHHGNFAPSFGFAWTPNPAAGQLKRLFGAASQTVLRGGYSLAFTQPSIQFFSNTFGGNPGGFLNTARNVTNGNLVGASLGSFPLLLRETNRLGPPAFPDSPAYPLKGAATDSATIFGPEIKIPYVQSWTFGIQREIGKDTAIEFRYVGNRHLQGWITFNFNERNIIENGFLDEFKLAQANLQANIAAGRCLPGQNPTANPGCQNNFRYFGPGTGTAPLPIYLAYFSGAPNGVKPAPNVADSYTSPLFANAGFVNPLAINNPNPYAPASASTSGTATGLYADPVRRANALAAGLPANFFVVNPGLLGGSSFVGNGGYSRYDSGVVELRRRLSKGLLIQSSYTFGKGFSSARVSLRRPRFNTINTDVIHHVFRANWIYELPIGKGKMLFGNAGGLVDKFISGWEFNGLARIQSGTPIDLGNVRLVGMTRSDLQKEVKLRFDDANRIVYALPDDIILNTRRANNISATSATGYGALGVPTGRYIAPANSSSCIEISDGDCAGTQTVVYGNQFTRFDLSAIKRTRITEKVNLEFRAEFLNAFNFINFNLNGFGGLGDATFGQITSAYRDISNSSETGGRTIQLVLRLNF